MPHGELPANGDDCGLRLVREMPWFCRRFTREKLVREQKGVEYYLEGLRLAGIPESREPAS